MATLKLPDELFWDCTSREIHACIQQHLRNEDRWNERFGSLHATLVNIQPQDPKRKRKTFEWTDFYLPFFPRKKRGQTLAEAQASIKQSRKLLKQGPLK